ncbi:MAG: leucine-rich repeat protein [Paludibacteraceae bacterium]|nr:leucine-rich repeat protein [Paludibacteraceae bacterium]
MRKIITAFMMMLCAACVASAANYLTFTAAEDGSTFGFVNKDNDPDVQYSLDGGETWTALPEGETVILAHKGDKALLKGDNSHGFSKNYGKYSTFKMTGKVAASGSVMSLIDGVGLSTEIPNNYCFRYLFSGCASLTQAPALPATILTEDCYDCMFKDCTGLTQAPALPAMTMYESCYDNMFSGCTSLTQAPELPAMTLDYRCYGGMFRGCTSLTQAPELPATELSRLCYDGMFLGCTSLTQAPELPATTLTECCYESMFEGCASLTQAPALPATKMAYACYSAMFLGCTSLTQAPELPAATFSMECYDAMFYGCTNLSRILVSFDDWNVGYCTSEWVKDVAPTGTFICPKDLPLEYGVSKIPEGWTVEYIEEEGTGVSSALADGVTVWTDDLTVHVCGAEGEVSLYDMSGRIVAVSNAADEECVLSVPSKGAYVVRTNGGSSVVLVR